MTKIPMLCPFSKKLCQECTIYRGRHYYICFRKEYRGYLGKEAYFQESTNGPSVIISRKKTRHGTRER